MTKKRTAIPSKTKDSVLKEYNHRCAMCGADAPQLHHIDENPSNHDQWNLVPLCPNCHLSDQHNPTARIETGRLRLFRRYKDPAILSPQFEPLFRRMAFLDLDMNALSTDELPFHAHELFSFVEQLEMGEFYSKRLRDLLAPPGRITVIGPECDSESVVQRHVEYYDDYMRQVDRHRDEAVLLIVELLRYQDWKRSDGVSFSSRSKVPQN